MKREKVEGINVEMVSLYATSYEVIPMYTSS